MRVLGIETSCDETAAAVVEDGLALRSNVIASQIEVHARYGGVVPEIASRHHVEAILPIIHQALEGAGCSLDEIDAVAVTNRPGLVGSLLVGVCAAKAIAYARRLPLVGVHHIEGHIFANFLAEGAVRAPAVALIASGGHTELFYVRGAHDYEVLGRRRDDAAGEAFDKGARAMGLAGSGGPAIDRLAREGDPTRVPFPRSLLDEGLDFSFSGLKTSLLRYLETRPEEVSMADVAASFQQAIVDVLVAKALRAAEQTGVDTLLVGGGVAANSRLQADLRAAAAPLGLMVSFPPLALCTDNAGMIAAAGASRLARGEIDGPELDTFARSPLTTRIYGSSPPSPPSPLSR
jgi:N6-L-threonylcarbamoyladenine synthase